MKSPELFTTRNARRVLLAGATLWGANLAVGCASNESLSSDKPVVVDAAGPQAEPSTSTTKGSVPETTTTVAPTTTAESTTTTSSTTTSTSTTTTTPSRPPVRGVDVQNLTFRADTCQFGRQPWEMKNGVATQTNQIAGESYPVTSELSITKVAYGDVNMDGVEDVVVLFDCKIPRERSIQMIGAYAAGDTSLERFGHAGLPESTLALDVSVTSPGNIRVDQTGQSYGIYEWQGNGLARQPDL